MKITPVAGTPTLASQSASGLNPEKIARIKALANGQGLGGVDLVEDSQKVLKTPEMPIPSEGNIETNTPNQGEEGLAEASTSAISDASVQANEGQEATKPLSPQFAALARQRRALQVKERELADKLKSLEGPTRAELEQKLKSQPLSVLQEVIGPDFYNKLTEDILAAQNGHNPQVKELEAKIQQLNQRLEERFTEAQTAQEEAAINYAADRFEALIKEGDEFEVIREGGHLDEAVRRGYQYWKKTGREPDYKAIALELEKEKTEEETSRFKKLTKIQRMLEANVSSELTSEESLQQQPQAATIRPQPPIRTLTNKDSAKPDLSRRQRAILAMRGELKR